MAKNFREIYDKEPELHEMRRLRIPDITTEKVSCWTYTDMKREFQKTMKLFAENGYEDECADLAYETVRLSVFFGNNTARTLTMTENIMALTLFINTILDVSHINQFLVNNYERFISEYRSSPIHGLILPPEEQAELCFRNGKVYGCAMGCLYFLKDSMEEFLESEARDCRKDELLLERRRGCGAVSISSSASESRSAAGA